MLRDLNTYRITSIPSVAGRKQCQASDTGWMKAMPRSTGPMQCQVLQDESNYVAMKEIKYVYTRYICAVSDKRRDTRLGLSLIC